MQNPISLLPRIKVSRTGRILAITLASTVMATVLVGPTQDAIANGDTRSLYMRHVHTGETINITFKRNGSYDSAALKQLDWFFRDWRLNQPTRMDPRTMDTLWLVYRQVGASQPINVIGGYRSPGTNNMLRRRSRGVAKFSQHTLGKAVDYFIPGVSLSKLRVAGLRLQRGGVGFYPSSGSPFVHMDSGGVRMWPRMSRSELASVFPDGKTVLVPSDGRPMAGYQLAMNEIRRNGGTAGGSVGEDDAGGSSSGGGFFAALFGSRSNSAPPPTQMAQAYAPTTRASARIPAVPPQPAPAAQLPAMQQMAMADELAISPRRVAPVPLPERRPNDINAAQGADAAAAQLASADTGPRMMWQTGPNGAGGEMAANVPLPPLRPGTAAEESQAAPVQLASLDTPPPVPVTRPVLDPKPPIFADLSQGSEGFMKRSANRQSQRALGFADPAPVTNTARPPRPALIATRFEKQNFASLSAPVSAARNKQQATLVKPDLRATASLIAAPSKTVVVRFGVAAYQDLRADKFTGAAVKPLRVASFTPMPDIFTGSIASN
ncbi:DUF882 domain-containing protein [Labrys neptuniae]